MEGLEVVFFQINHFGPLLFANMPAGKLMDCDEVLFAAKLPINLEERIDTISGW